MATKKKTTGTKKKSSTKKAKKAARPVSRKKPSRPAAKKAARNTATQPGKDFLQQLLHRFGILRLVLIGIAIIAIASALKPGTRAVYEGWDLVPTVLLPVLAPLIFMVLLLDALMGRVLMADKSGKERERLRLTVIVNLLLAAGLALFWTPFYMALVK